jgi:hypothetical protein
MLDTDDLISSIKHPVSSIDVVGLTPVTGKGNISG